MTGIQSLEARAAVGVAMSAASVGAWYWAPRIRASNAAFRRVFMTVYALSRLGLYAVAFVLLHMVPRGDINLYMDEAIAAFGGHLVYRDFGTPHAPLDPYLLEGMLRIHNNPLTIIFFAVVFDLVTMWIWMRVGERFLSTTVFRRATLLMLLNATSLLTVAIDGQMNALIALLLALGVAAWASSREFLSGASVAASAATVKFLAWIFSPGFFFVSRRKWAWLAGFLVVTVGVYGGFALAGADIRYPLHAEGGHKTSSNVFYLIELLTGHDLGDRLPDLFLAASWFTVVALTWRAARRTLSGQDSGATALAFQVLALSMIAEMMCVQVFSKNTWDRYLVMTMFPLCLLVAECELWQIWVYAAWSVVNVSYRSFWSTVTIEPVATDQHVLALHGNHAALVVVAGEILQTSGNIFFFGLCVQRLLQLARLTGDRNSYRIASTVSH
jgi:hypothetical protein